MATGITSSITGNATYSNVLELTAYDDVLNINNATLNFVLPAGDIELMQGNDTVNITNSTVNGATGVAIKLGSGNDTVVIEKSTIRSSIRLGTGEDYAVIGGNSTDVVTLNALDPDQTSIDTSEDLTTLSMGGGNDVLELKGTLKGDGVINFGAGNDTLKFNGGRLANKGGIANINNLSVTTVGGTTERDIILYGTDNYFELNGNFTTTYNCEGIITIGAVENAPKAAFTLKVDDDTIATNSLFKLSINNRTFTQVGSGNWGGQTGITATDCAVTLCNFINTDYGWDGANTDWNLKNFQILGGLYQFIGGQLSFEDGTFTSSASRSASIYLKNASLVGNNVNFNSYCQISATSASIELTSGNFSRGDAALLLKDTDIKLNGIGFFVNSTALFQNSGSARLSDVSFSQNSQCIYLSGANLTAENITFVSNYNARQYGSGSNLHYAGVLNANSGYVSFSNAVFSANYSTNYYGQVGGPVVYLNSCECIFDNAIFQDNQADCILTSNHGKLTLVDVQFSNNTNGAIRCDNRAETNYILSAGKTISQVGNGTFLTGTGSANFTIKENAHLIIGSSTDLSKDSISGQDIVKNGSGTMTVYSGIKAGDNTWTLMDGLTQLLAQSRYIYLDKWTIKAPATLQLSEKNDTLNSGADTQIEGTVDLGGGSDVIIVRGNCISGGKLLISTLTINGAGGKVSSAITTRTADAAFDLTLDDVTLESTITGGNGDDKITVTKESTISGAMDLGNGKNVITATDVTFANTLTTGNGNDSITATGNATFSQEVTLSAGNDTLTVGGNASFNKALDLGDGDNSVSADGSFSITGSLTGGSGNDTISLLGTGTTASFNQIVDLGGGTNKIHIAGTLTGVREFQITDVGSTSVIIYRSASVDGNTVTAFTSPDASLRALTLDWSDIEDLDKVRILVSSDPTFQTYEFNLELYNRVKSFTINIEEGYFYQFQANDEDGWAIRYLTDEIAPDQVTGLETAMEGGVTVAQWAATHDNWGGNGVSQYRVQIATDSAFKKVVQEQLVGENHYALDGLAEGNYFCRVQAIDYTGNVGQWSETYSFTYEIPDTVAPTAPASLTAQVNGGKVNLDWRDSTDADSGIDYYQVTYATNSSFTNAQTRQVTASELKNLALTDGNYYWKVKAVDKAGNASEEIAGTTFRIDTTAPAAVGGLAATLNKNTIDFSWNTTTDNLSGVAKYELEVSSKSDFSTLVASKSGATLTSFSLSFSGSGTYYYRVRATDGAGNASAWTTKSVSYDYSDTEPPTVPTNLRITQNGTQVTFAWNASTDDGSGVAGYELALVRNGRTETVSQVNGTSVTLELAESDYAWSVVAKDIFGNRSAAANGTAFRVLVAAGTPAQVRVDEAGVAQLAQGTTGDEAFSLTPDGTWGTYHVARWNGGSDKLSLAGFNRFQDVVVGNGGYDVLQLPDADNALLYSDLLTPKADGANGASRFTGIAEIAGGNGKDVIDLTNAQGGYAGDILLKGGDGDDHLWAGKGDDLLIGGTGDDDLRGGAGDDAYLFGQNWGHDTILDDGGTLVFDNTLKGQLSFSATGDGTRITNGTNSVDLTWQVTAAEVAYADVASLTELRRDTIKGFLA